MSRTESTMLPLGTPAPDFALPDAQSGQTISRDDFADAPVLLVAFICNHCPYVKYIRAGWAQLARDYQSRGVAIVAISSNDAVAYPDDAPDKMREEAIDAGYTFPYLFDDSQEIAKNYRAACTPDFYVFDGDRKLVYRGQMDGARRRNDIPVTGEDLRAALDAVLNGTEVPTLQKPSLGCNIKWKEGNAPEYF